MAMDLTRVVTQQLGGDPTLDHGSLVIADARHPIELQHWLMIIRVLLGEPGVACQRGRNWARFLQLLSTGIVSKPPLGLSLAFRRMTRLR
eukprot:11950136-Heterocapsa_arctica.AAC.1